MEKVLLNPGYHHITEKILNSLNFQSRFSLSQTNKEIMKVCERVMIAKGRKTSIFEGINCQNCVVLFTNVFQDLVTFVKENDIYYFGCFTFKEPNSQKKNILQQFVQIVSELEISSHNWINRNKLRADYKCYHNKYGYVGSHIFEMSCI